MFGAAAQTIGERRLAAGANHQAFHRLAAELGGLVGDEPRDGRRAAVFGDGLADTLRNVVPAGDGDAMRLGLVGHDIDEIVVVEDVGEFEQGLRHLDRIIGKLVDHIARRAIERRQELGHMGARLDLDKLGQLAEHLVVLRDLLVVAAIGHVGIELRHVAEQLVALEDIGVAVEDPEGRERALAVFHLLRHLILPGFCRYRDTMRPAPGLRLEGTAANLSKIVRSFAAPQGW